MTQPLSPLSPSFGNSRTQSPAYAPPSAVRRRRGIDEIMSSTDEYDKENGSPKPAKRAFYSYDGSADDELIDDKNDDYDSLKTSTTPARRNDNNNIDDIGDDMTVDLNDGPPSSPFQYDTRDDTVDMNRLQAMTMSASRRTTTSPQKKQGPVIYVDEQDRIDEIDTTEQYDAGRPSSGLDDTTTMSDNDKNDDNDGSVLRVEPKQTEHSTIGNSYMEDRHNEEMSTVAHHHSSEESSHLDEARDNDTMDDTCFSTFSAVPNVDMTMFAKLGQSPTKKIGDIMESPAVNRTPGYYRRSKATTPATAHRRGLMVDDDTSPTPQRRNRPGSDESVNLLDFNDSFNYFHRVSQRFSMSSNRASMSPRRRSPLKPRDPMRSPAKYNLIDFDMPPPATPMSIPSITPRELESLKSGFLSEISSLKATLSGKEAEVASLKQAVADAERRVGEALEEVRNEAIRKEALEVEQAEWERRGKEMETVLREVRAEIIDGERERERLTKKNDEAERLKEQHEGRIVELESQLAAAKKAAAANPSGTMTNDNGDKVGMLTPEESAKEVQEAVERVARELHTLYKGKHETKVAALKKSYESRWEKRVREAENKLRDANEEVERLKTERDTTMSGPLNPNMSMMSVMGRDNEELETENKVLGAQIKGLEEQLSTIKRDNEQLHAELKMERTEKGELVAAVDEWLAMQQASTSQPGPPSSREVSNSSAYYSASEQETLLTSSASSSFETSPRKRSIDEGAIELPHQHHQQQPPQQQQPLFKRSISRTGPSSNAPSSGLRPPSSGTTATGSTGIEKRSRLGMYSGGNAGHSRHNSGGNGGRSIAMPATTPGRSGIMSSIERMGAGER
ncbi:hypothetical protein EYB25_004184 [Talaromyces marneffei]|uniref:Kinetoplast-associated protein KAP n=1 Tax=Talaromyces marneffei (strain ATCC 18224 / CBS 334.59 / QM 7333) TaxID=441960 RepID=B6QD13_TALMQ|nr:conserved hypothetical protein [Talaromyces marneffei ATCC 18224]KAE8552805.1 hypothetical protein EYB25_004184 [Talaromyces marneffei]